MVTLFSLRLDNLLQKKTGIIINLHLQQTYTGGAKILFRGISKTFSTVGEQQYNTIGKFWDEMSAIYGLENLRGLGYNWKDDSIEYVIGLKNNEIFDVSDAGVWKEITLPDSGWKTYSGTTERLGAMYDEIYKEGRLTYEIEEFFEDGSCKVMITR